VLLLHGKFRSSRRRWFPSPSAWYGGTQYVLDKHFNLELEDAQNQYTPHVLDLLLGLLQVVASMHSCRLSYKKLQTVAHGAAFNLCAWRADDITPYMTAST
jgi:hypothetical protein